MSEYPRAWHSSDVDSLWVFRGRSLYLCTTLILSCRPQWSPPLRAGGGLLYVCTPALMFISISAVIQQQKSDSRPILLFSQRVWKKASWICLHVKELPGKICRGNYQAQSHLCIDKNAGGTDNIGGAMYKFHAQLMWILWGRNLGCLAQQFSHRMLPCANFTHNKHHMALNQPGQGHRPVVKHVLHAEVTKFNICYLQEGLEKVLVWNWGKRMPTSVDVAAGHVD